jgi:2-dehydropantoate 2-reductase
MRVLVVGAGAVGGFFGARLAEDGREVTFLVRARRAQVLRQHGLRLRRDTGELVTLTPRLAVVGEPLERQDLILLAVKAYDLEAAMHDFAPAVSAQTVIVPLLNGLRHLDVLDHRFGRSAVIGGTCMVSTTVEPDGTIAQLADRQSLLYGERDGTATPRLQAVHETLSAPGLHTTLSGEIMQDLWDKWVGVAALGAANGLLRGAVGEVVAQPGGAALAEQLFEECAVIAALNGHRPRPSFRARMLPRLTEAGSAFTSSMYRDLLAGGRLEVDHLLGDLLARTNGVELEVPLLRSAFVALSMAHGRVGR